MKVCVTQRSPEGSWTKQLPDWDGPCTLVQLFGPASLLEDSTPIEEVANSYPNSVVIGCSGAGVLADDHITDSDLVVAVTKFRDVKLSVAYSQATDNVAGNETYFGRKALDRILAEAADTRGILLMSSGHDIDGDALGEGFQSSNGLNVYKIGGRAFWLTAWR